MNAPSPRWAPCSRIVALVRFLEEFFPLGDAPEVETIRQRTVHVGTRLEMEAVAPSTPVRPTAAQSIALVIDGGHNPRPEP